LRTITVIAGLLVLIIAFTPLAALGDEVDGKPEITPQMAQVNAGDSFDLEVSVLAWADGNYTVTFQERSRFTFPGIKSETQTMASGDAILFQVRCEVDSGTPDGDFPIDYIVSWDVNGTVDQLEGQVEVKVGEGAGSDSPCESIILLAPVAVVSFGVLLVGNRRNRRE
jgi:hypothetical protein